MDLLSLIVLIVLVGFVMYLVNNYIPLEPRIKSLLNIVVMIVLIFWLLSGFGVLDVLRRPIVTR